MTTEAKMMERKTAPLSFELKVIGDQGEIEGYALTYGNVDQGGDICLKGCATNTLRKRPPPKVKMLLSHDTQSIIGKWTDFIDDDKGLFGKGRLFLDIQKGRETYALIKEDAIDGLSIGYRTIKDAYDPDRKARLLEEIEIREVSICPFPMNEEAIITSVKQASDIKTVREFEELLRSVGFSAGAAKGIAAKGFREGWAGTAGGVQDVLEVVKRSFGGLADVIKRDFSQDERDRAARSGHAMPDGSYPINTAADLRNAIQAIGRAKNPAAVRRHIMRRARALGLTRLLPEDWQD